MEEGRRGPWIPRPPDVTRLDGRQHPGHPKHLDETVKLFCRSCPNSGHPPSGRWGTLSGLIHPSLALIPGSLPSSPGLLSLPPGLRLSPSPGLMPRAWLPGQWVNGVGNHEGKRGHSPERADLVCASWDSLPTPRKLPTKVQGQGHTHFLRKAQRWARGSSC